MGRPKLYGERIELPVAEGTKAAIDTALDDGETRLDFIRLAIKRELERRRKKL